MATNNKDISDEVDGPDDGEAVAATFKILVLGSSLVGKTSFIQAYAHGKKPDSRHRPTLGVDFTNIVVEVRGVKVRLRVWDTAGQEKFHTFTKQFFRGAQGVMILYDVTSMSSFQDVKKWRTTLRSEGLTDVHVVIVGNKCDMEDQRTVPAVLAQQLASEDYWCTCIETSVVTSYNVKKCFHNLAQTLIHSRNIFLPGREASFGQASVAAYDPLYHSTTSESIVLGEAPPNSARRCC